MHVFFLISCDKAVIGDISMFAQNIRHPINLFKAVICMFTTSYGAVLKWILGHPKHRGVVVVVFCGVLLGVGDGGRLSIDHWLRLCLGLNAFCI